MSEVINKSLSDSFETTLERLLSELKDSVGVGPKRWLSIAEGSAYTGLSVASLKTLLASGKLTSHRPVRGRVLLDRHEIDSVIQSSTNQIRRGRGTWDRNRISKEAHV